MSTPSVSVVRNYSATLLTVGSRIPEKRKAEAERIRQKYPDRIPVRIFHEKCIYIGLNALHCR